MIARQDGAPPSLGKHMHAAPSAKDDAVRLEAPRGAKDGASGGRHQRGHQPQGSLPQFVRRQRVVLRTLVAVALLAELTGRLSSQQHRQLRGNMLAGTVIYMLGDWAAQLLSHWRASHPRSSCLAAILGSFRVDGSRFVINAIVGALWAGVANPSVYAAAERLFPGAEPREVLLKMVLTRCVLSTCGNFVTMFFRRFAKRAWEMGRESPPRSDERVLPALLQCARSCADDFPGVLRDDLKLFPLYDVLCYSVIPPGMRTLPTAFVASGWAVYMSMASFKTEREAEERETVALVEKGEGKEWA